MNREFEGKKLLIIGGTTTECDIVRYAKAKGVYTIVADYDPNAPGMKVADKAALISARDVDALVEFCEQEKVDGVITGFVDILLRPYMEVCKRLHLPCYITEKMLSMSTNKVDFKETCEKYGVPVPHTHLVGGSIDANTIKKISYPVFVKPLDASGSRGAGVCNNEQELRTRFIEAVGYSSGGNAIVEDYITGKEFLLDYVGVGGTFRLLSIFDRYVASDRGSAVNYSTIAISPSRSVDFYLKNINGKVINMFKDLGFSDGLMFLQGYYDGSKVTFYEMGCRLGGSYFAHEQECLGDNAIDMVVRYALTGKMVYDLSSIPEDAARYKKYAVDCNYLVKGEDETVAKIIGLEEVGKLPGVIEILKYHDVGYHYGKDKLVDKPMFTVELVADTKEDLIDKINYVNQTVDVLNEDGVSLLMEKLNPEILFA
jgi:biotin carboxylase